MQIPAELAGKRRLTHAELAHIASIAFGRGYAEGAGAGTQFAVFDLEAAGELAVRAWEPGDTIVPFGMRGKRKLQDLFTDAKVPKAKRKLWPVLTLSDGAIGWVPGIRQAVAEGRTRLAGLVGHGKEVAGHYVRYK